MRVFQFTVPLRNRPEFEEDLAAHFGGFTRSHGVRGLDESPREAGARGGRCLRALGEEAMYFAEVGTARIEFLSGLVPAEVSNS